MKKTQLVLRWNKEWNDWDLLTMEGELVESVCPDLAKQLLRPGREKCLILDITVHPAEWIKD